MLAGTVAALAGTTAVLAGADALLAGTVAGCVLVVLPHPAIASTARPVSASAALGLIVIIWVVPVSEPHPAQR